VRKPQPQRIAPGTPDPCDPKFRESLNPEDRKDFDENPSLYLQGLADLFPAQATVRKTQGSDVSTLNAARVKFLLEAEDFICETRAAR
jgi:hypothetical protein